MMRFLLLGLLAVAPATWAQDEEMGWPREIDDPRAEILLYQPQIDSLDGNDLNSRAAVSVTPAGKTEPVFGAVWLESRIATDRDTRTVTILETKVPRVRFPDATEEQEKELAAILVNELNGRPLTFALDRLLTALELAEHERKVATDLKHEPPVVRFVDYPAILVTIDGEPQLRDIEGRAPLKHVVNSPFLIVLSGTSYYLYAGQAKWYAATAIAGPWMLTQGVPEAVAALAPVDEEEQARERMEEAAEEAGEELDLGPKAPPAIVIATEPTELIVTEGPPEYKPLGSDLLYVSNTESDVLVDIATKRHFVLLSGRWFAGPGTEGPWSDVAPDALPPSFAAIPEDSDMGHVRVWVAGTEEAEEAVLDAAIPQTAAVERDATIQVDYDGAPRFEEIEGTSLAYASNTGDQVIRDGERFYCVRDGIWYVAPAASGPWAVATKVPKEIRDIPPSSPVYNTKYVYIYDTTPQVVYVGYYPGYTHSYIYHGTIVYGTGWYYPPWWGAVYYPRPATYGFHVRWNPWYGWSFGFSYTTGRFTFGVGFGGFGGWHRGGYWGPVGYRPYYRGYARGWHHGYRRGFGAGYAMGRLDHRYRNQNIYRRARAARPVTRPVARPANRPQARPAPSRPNNMYTDRAGNVRERTPSGEWRSRAGSGRTPSQMNRDYQARQRGAARARSFQQSRGGARRGGRRR